jgi:hypothetical protein
MREITKTDTAEAVRYRVTGVDCSACAAKIETTARSVDCRSITYHYRARCYATSVTDSACPIDQNLGYSVRYKL